MNLSEYQIFITNMIACNTIANQVEKQASEMNVDIEDIIKRLQSKQLDNKISQLKKDLNLIVSDGYKVKHNKSPYPKQSQQKKK